MYFYVTLVLGSVAICTGCAIPETAMGWGVVSLTGPLCEAC